MEKGGGKGFSLPTKAPKSALKPTAAKDASTKGKDDSSVKSKKGRKIQLDSEVPLEAKFDFSSKCGGKFDATIAKGHLNKGGKGDRVATGGRVPVTKEPTPLELKVEAELPKNAKCMMDCEAAQILQGIQEQMVLLSQDPTIKLPLSYDRGLQFAKTGAHYTNPQSVRRVLETLTKHGVSDGEICVIANVYPETVDEVFALVPSLKSRASTLRQPLKDVLSELAKFKQLA